MLKISKNGYLKGFCLAVIALGGDSGGVSGCGDDGEGAADG